MTEEQYREIKGYLFSINLLLGVVVGLLLCLVMSTCVAV